MNPSHKIEMMLNHLGINAKAFSEKLGYERPQIIYDIIKGKTKKISVDLTDKITSVFPEFSRSWLLADEGEMCNGIPDSVEEISENNIITPYFKERSLTYVPVVHLDSVGGMHSENQITAGEQYFERLIPFEEAREGDIAIYQSGDSMSPSIPSGSLLLLRKVEDWKEYIGYGNVFVLWLRDDRRITKMVTRYDEDPKNYVWCVSYNPNVPDEELPRKMIREVWKVVKFQTNLGW